MNSFFVQSSTVRLGAHQINATNDDFSQYVKVIRAEAHPNYERFGIIDIAILHLERDVDATRKLNNKSFFFFKFKFSINSLKKRLHIK